MAKTILCGLNCDCPHIPTPEGGIRDCKLSGTPNARQRDAEMYAPTSADTYTVLIRVLHRLSNGEEAARTVPGPTRIPADEARARAVEAGTAGVFDDLTYYPPGRVLSVRLSRDA